MTLWILIPLILGAWLAAGFLVALFVGPVLARNSRVPVQSSDDREA